MNQYVYDSFSIFFRFVISLILVSVILGCTTVKISGANAEISRSFVGLVNVDVCPNTAQPSIVVTEGAGITTGLRSTNFGWLKEALIFTDDLSTCRVYVLIERNEDLESLKKLFTKLENICVITKEGRIWPAEI